MAEPTSISSRQLTLSIGSERKIFSVSELNSTLQTIFENDFQGIWVAGEISGTRAAGSGHYYFTLKDKNSQLKCALFRGAARFAKFSPADGLAVLARGKLEIYEARGEYQLIVELLQPQGFGGLQLAFERLKSKLAAEGLFESSRKRALPALPNRIGLITSPTGAVLRDILQILERRFPGLHIRLFPTLVQGENASEQICAALRYFSETSWADVVIVARGGGSLEDLWAFNEEAVARAIAASKIPVISAIGHETDFTIADFVADYRAATPSAAAEIVICTRDHLLDRLQGCRSKAIQSIRYRLLIASRELNRKVGERALSLTHRLITKRTQQLDDLDWRLQVRGERLFQVRRRQLADLARRLGECNLQLRFARSRHKHELLSQRLTRVVQNICARLGSRLDTAQTQIVHLSPIAVLGRGYAVVQKQSGQIVRSSSETIEGEQLSVRLNRGGLGVMVAAIREPSKAEEL